ncbi:MAG: hypothetical protein EBT17_00680 [Actinobacteria bacterium]|nr:hypothetical protein [Actinomycetota bacterium]
MARDKTPEYLKVVGEVLKFEYSDFAELLLDVKCVDCKTVYLDPRPSVRLLNQVYIRNAPIHHAGWSRFTKALLGEDPDDKLITAVQKYLSRENLVPRSYLEVGCPFNGLGLSLTDPAQLRAAVADRSNSRDYYSSSTRRRVFRYSTGLARLEMKLQELLARYWVRLQSFRRPQALIRQVDLQPAEVTLLAEFSTNRWMVECRGYGMSCLNAAGVALSATTISREHLKEMPANSFDLGGLFNTLDHSDEPLELLQMLTRTCKRLIFAGHSMREAYLQHRFAFAADTIPLLCEKFSVDCRDLSSELGEASDGWYVFLIDCDSNVTI